MKPIFKQLPVAMLAALSCACAIADDGLEIDDAWIAEAPPVSKVMAAYMEIENETREERAATSMQCSEFERTEFHRTIEEDGIARMQHQPVLRIAAGSELELRPGSYHVMLFNPARPMAAGDSTRCSMTFDDGTSISFELDVKKTAVEDHSHHHH